METTIKASKGHVEIPTRVRKKLGFKSKNEIVSFEKNGELVIRPFTKSYLKKFVGILKGKGDPIKGLKEERAREREL